MTPCFHVHENECDISNQDHVRVRSHVISWFHITHLGPGGLPSWMRHHRHWPWSTGIRIRFPRRIRIQPHGMMVIQVLSSICGRVCFCFCSGDRTIQRSFTVHERGLGSSALFFLYRCVYRSLSSPCGQFVSVSMEGRASVLYIFHLRSTLFLGSHAANTSCDSGRFTHERR